MWSSLRASEGERGGLLLSDSVREEGRKLDRAEGSVGQTDGWVMHHGEKGDSGSSCFLRRPLVFPATSSVLPGREGNR